MQVLNVVGFEKREIFLHNNHNAILQARLEGEAKGREEDKHQKAMEIARSLLDVLDVETITQKTGLSVAEIQQLR